MSDNDQINTGTQRGIAQFSATTASLEWDIGHVEASLLKLFKAVNQLALTDLAYYQNRVRYQSSISYCLRVAGAFFGTLGVISPALVATEAEFAKCIAKWGYFFFSLSGSAFAVNSLFGGTSGHARYVATQIKLEEVIARYGVKWSQYSARATVAAMPPTAPAHAEADAAAAGGAPANQPIVADNGSTSIQAHTARGFELILEFLREFTTATQQETLQWASDIVNDTKNYALGNEK
jgi:hypothetical protein